MTVDLKSIIENFVSHYKSHQFQIMFDALSESGTDIFPVSVLETQIHLLLFDCKLLDISKTAQSSE